MRIIIVSKTGHKQTFTKQEKYLHFNQVSILQTSYFCLSWSDKGLGWNLSLEHSGFCRKVAEK